MLALLFAGLSGVDSTNAAGLLILGLMAKGAHIEADRSGERTKEVLAAAKDVEVSEKIFGCCHQSLVSSPQIAMPWTDSNFS